MINVIYVLPFEQMNEPRNGGAVTKFVTLRRDTWNTRHVANAAE